jgi:Spy/CpxP family protein refolding chaperone
VIAMPALAQKGGKSSYNKEKLESAKIAFITKRLDLTPKQAEKFWPLYNQHYKNKKELLKNADELMKIDEEEISNKEATVLIDKKIEIEQKILDLEKNFLKDIIQVISPVQALKLGEVKREFTRHIYRMQKRRKPSD